MKATIENCTVCIPTNSRPASLQRCINAVRNNISPNIPIQIAQGTPPTAPQSVHADYAEIFSDNADLSIVHLNDNSPPGRSRRILSEECQTQFILFMDDDNEIRPGAFEVLSSAQQEYSLDIASGSWIDKVRDRPIGYFYIDGWGAGGAAIHKFPIPQSPAPQNSALVVHDVLATMLCRKAIFSDVSFDDQYDFFFELFDFFMSCRKKNIKIGVAPAAKFYHRPAPYFGITSRQKQDRHLDEKRFRKKWGAQPIIHPIPHTSKTSHLRRRLAGWLKASNTK